MKFSDFMIAEEGFGSKNKRNMTDIVSLIKSLPDLLPLKPATEKQVADAELQLGIKFSGEYKEYLYAFGAIIADGIELTGIAKADNRNVVTITKNEWGLNSKVPHTMYVIANAGIDGILIWQNADGFVYQTKPNTKPRQIAASLAEYIVSCVD